MKRISVRNFGEPGVMKLEDAELPALHENEVLVSIKAIGVNPVDTYIRSGIYPIKPELPYTPGIDASGVIEKTGKGVSRVKEGDRVYVMGSLTGTYAQSCVSRESQVYKLPENISFQQGAAVPIPYATAYQAIYNKAGVGKGQTILIHGATGGVGIAAVQIAKAAGIKVIGTGGTEKGRDLVLKEGAEHVLDHHAPDYLAEVMKITEGRGVDAVLEMLADVNLEKDLGVLAHRGTVIVIGCRGTIEINPRELMSCDTSIMGMLIFNATEEETDKIHEHLYAGMSNGSLRPVVGHEMPLAEAAQAHYQVVEAPAYGKIILIP